VRVLCKPPCSDSKPSVVHGYQPILGRPRGSRTETHEEIHQTGTPTGAQALLAHILAKCIRQILARKAPGERIEIEHSCKPSIFEAEVKRVEVAVYDLQRPRRIRTELGGNRQKPAQSQSHERMPTRKITYAFVLPVRIILPAEWWYVRNTLQRIRKFNVSINKRIGLGIRHVHDLDPLAFLPFETNGATFPKIGRRPDQHMRDIRTFC